MKKVNKTIFEVILLAIGILLFSNAINSSYGLDIKDSEETQIVISNNTIDKKIGMNGHIDVPQDILTAGSVVREYHNFGWSMTENKQMFFNRFSWWNFDKYYKDLSEKGITVLPCIQMGEQSIFNRNRNEKPVIKGDDTTDPFSYKIHSNYLFNYAARYGKTIVEESRLNLDPNEEVKTGLGYITYYEDWNEPDKTWQGPDAQFNSTELAAMLSADYDGHEGRLGDTYGIKKADPNSKLVMGGMAGGSTMVTWLNEIQSWANINRTDKKIPLDVINYHQYAGTHSPENSTFVEDAKKIITWRDTNAKEKEIWITEFGWDTNPGSTKHAAPSENTQRDWIIREYLIGDRIGLDRMTVYDALNDGPSNDTTQYSTSGLATKVSEGTVKKPSWYGVNTLKNTLMGYTLSEVIKENDEIYIYKYIKEDDTCYVLWSPTENNTIISDYVLDIGKYSTATLTTLMDKEPLGITSNLTINNNMVVVNVSESPIFVKVSGKIADKEITDDNNKETQIINNDNNKVETENKETQIINEEIQEKNEEVIKNVLPEVKNIINDTIIISNDKNESTTETITENNNDEIGIGNIADNYSIDNNSSSNNNGQIIDYDDETEGKTTNNIEEVKPEPKKINDSISNTTTTQQSDNKKTSNSTIKYILFILLITIIMVLIIIIIKKNK